MREEFKQLRLVNEQLLHRLEQLLKLSFGSKREHYLGKEQSSGQLRLGLIEEVTVEVPVQAPVPTEQVKPVPLAQEKKKHFVIPESIVEEIQKIHPDVIPEGSKCTGSEVSYRLKCSPARLTTKKIIRYKYLLPTPAGDPGLTIKIITIEGIIRGIALGRKNFIFCGSHDAAQRSAMLYSFMGTCKLQSINPMVWMVDVLKKSINSPQTKSKIFYSTDGKGCKKLNLCCSVSLQSTQLAYY